MAEYQVLARKYRPQTFGEILGQDALVQTLKNAIKYGRLAHAYLFSGPRGTGKTTTARIFAKSLNCPNRGSDFEPCNKCRSCKEITAGHSLDVLEIDGASHRGIEDIRQINETAGYAAGAGGYKIYIIDEVHMLTKEAFNALLKTLEEPPPRVLFFFATTEPHKLLPTIISRCQRFHLNRIPHELIVSKLSEIARDLEIEAEEEALHMIAILSDGGLRDAESLFDQIIAFHDESITAKTIASVLGVASKDILFELDQAGKEDDIAKAFEIVDTIYKQGKDIAHFLDSLIDHYRTILLMIISRGDTPYLTLSESERDKYIESAKYYRKDQCLSLLDTLLDAKQHIRFSSSPKIALEALLMRIIRSHRRVPVEFLVKRLHELEKNLGASESTAPPKKNVAETPELKPQALPAAPAKNTISEDPDPDPEEIPIVRKKTTKKTQNSAPPPPPKKIEDKKSKSRYDTLYQFAAVELEGIVERN